MSQRAESAKGSPSADNLGHVGIDVDEKRSDNPAGDGQLGTTPGRVTNPRRRISKRTARERLQPFLDKARSRQQYQYRLGKVIKYGMNFIIFLQITVGALVTIVSVIEPSNKTRIATAVLGAVSTFTASIIARAKGTNQPELADTHARDLERFIGECQLFVDDMGDDTFGEDVDERVEELARLFEEIEDKAAEAYKGRNVELKKQGTQAASTAATTSAAPLRTTSPAA